MLWVLLTAGRWLLVFDRKKTPEGFRIGRFDEDFKADPHGPTEHRASGFPQFRGKLVDLGDGLRTQFYRDRFCREYFPRLVHGVTDYCVHNLYTIFFLISYVYRLYTYFKMSRKRVQITKVIPVRISHDLDREIKSSAKEIGLSQADTIRKAIEKGLPGLVQILGKAA